MRHLAAIAISAGLRTLVAEVLPDNMPMLKVFERSGFPRSVRHEAQVAHVSLELSSTEPLPSAARGGDAGS